MTRPADFSTTDLLAWARTKPADEAYPYFDTCGCAFYQFLKERGLPVRAAGGQGNWADTSGGWHDAWLPSGILSDEPYTFGALVARLEAICPTAVSDWAKLDAYLADIETVSA